MPNRFGADERRLLETTASRIYSNAVASGYLPSDDPRLAEDSAERPALELLIDLGLLRLDPESGHYLPVDPSAVQSQVVGLSARRVPSCSTSRLVGPTRSRPWGSSSASRHI